jgi:hypothetical protein
MFAERLFLAPSMWLVLAAACAAKNLTARGRRLAAALALIVCATQVPVSAARSLDWRTTESLMAAQVEAQPDSVKGHMHHATALAQAGRWDEALWHLAVAADGRRAFPGPWHAPLPGADLSPEDRALRLPEVFAPGSDPLAYFGGLRRAATTLLGLRGGPAVDDLVRRYMAAFPAPPARGR